MTTVEDPGPRAATIPPSCVHAVYRSVNSWQQRTGRAVARLDVGEPHFAPPMAAVDALAKATRDGRTGYTSAEGMQALRVALAGKLQDVNRHDTAPDRVFICTGASQGLTALLQSLTNPGDEILLPSLHWPIHLQQSLLVGLRPAFYPLDENFQPDVDALRVAGGKNTRVLLVNSPSNPTGAVCDEQRLSALLQLAHEREWQVVSDEAYEDFVFEGRHVSMASLERDLRPDQRRVSTVFSFSKSFAMTGYRLGYVVAPDTARGATLQVVQEASILSSPTPVQYAGLAALDAHQELADNRESVRSARDSLRPLADDGLLAHFSEGGWFALLDAARLGVSADRFAAELLERDAIAVAPAEGFALRPTLTADGRTDSMGVDPLAKQYVRLAYCGTPETVSAAATKIVAFADSLRTKGWSE
jgi:aspartate aminotransferase